MSIQLSEHFSYKKLIKFTIPTIIMMIFTSIYGVVDGIFVSNCVGSDAFAAVNLIMPALMILGTIGFMIGTGGSALVSKTIGEGNKEKANQYFSMLIYLLIIIGFIFTAVGIPFVRTVADLLGAENIDELKNLLKKSLKLIGITSLVMTGLAELLSEVLASIFVSYDTELLAITTRAIRLFSLSYIISGFNIFSSSFFTALNDGLVSATISFLRTLLFQVTMIFILPLILGLDGIWLAVVFAEILSLIVSIIFLFSNRKKYKYA